MNFSEALQAMKNGKNVKRKIWGGYWCWDAEKETIMIRTKDDEVLDIRETKTVEYTISHILETDWVEATDENCPVLGGEVTFGFGVALQYMQKGYKLTRKVWKNKVCVINSDGHMTIGPVCWGDFITGTILTGEDVLAKDWMFAKR